MGCYHNLNHTLSRTGCLTPSMGTTTGTSISIRGVIGGAIVLFLALGAGAQQEPDFVLHSISLDDELAVISWRDSPMVAVAPGQVVLKLWTVSSITDGKVIFANQYSGDQLLLDKHGLELITKTIEKGISPTPIRPSS